MTIAALIVAAGRGIRAGGDTPKQWRTLGEARVIDHAVAAFRDLVDVIVVVHHADDSARVDTLEDVTLVVGGQTRAASVQAGLNALTGQGITKVLIHDAARALTPRAVITDVIDALDYAPAAAPALAVTDALWRGVQNAVVGTHPRDGLYRAQTPQGFHFDAIKAAHDSYTVATLDEYEFSRAAGLAVSITQGHEDNFKITHAEDFARAEALLATRMGQADRKGHSMLDIRLGNGYDVHRFGVGDHVWLCGVKVDHDRCLQGHSDADVGMHALTDAIYGALAEGDIGRHFPPSDMKWKGAQSHIFLRHAIELARAKGYALMNSDVTLICERPKIGPHADAMRVALADILAVDLDRVSVKATTSEKLGFTGREEGIASIATVALAKL